MQHPLVLQVGSVTISLMGLVFFIGILFAFFVTFRRSREDHISEETAFDMGFLSIIFGFFGARLFYIAANLDFFGFNIISYLSFVSKPGLIYWGAVVGVLLIIYWSLKITKIDFFKFLDMFVFGAVIWQIMAIIGLYLDGSYNGITQVFSLGGNEYVWQHPIVLYEILFLAMMLWLLHRLSNEYRTYLWYKGKKSEAKPGFLVLTYFIGYSLFRLVLALVKTYPLYLKQLDIVLSGFFLCLSALVLILRSGVVTEAEWGSKLRLPHLGKGNKAIKVKNKPKLKLKKDRSRKSKHFKAGREAK